MRIHITRQRLIDTLLIGAFTLSIGSFHAQPTAAQSSQSNLREIARELNLSRSQMVKIASIKRSFDSELEDILTPEQIETLESARKQQQSRPQTQDAKELKEELNLTDSQSEQLAEAREDMVEELEEVLTPNQLEEIMEKTAFSSI